MIYEPPPGPPPPLTHPSGPSAASIPRPEHPRPHFVRPTDWQILNGQWDLAFDDADRGLDESWGIEGSSQFDHVITVPFTHQWPLSGLRDDRKPHPILWYKRQFRPSRPLRPDERLLLHFGAVDYQATVWVDGAVVATHVGGHTPFSADITPQVSYAAQNGLSVPIVVRVFDAPHDLTQPRGKQYWKPQSESIFYTPSSGIWQSVWTEVVPRTRLERATITPNIDDKTLSVDVSISGLHFANQVRFSVDVQLHGHRVATEIVTAKTADSTASVKLPVGMSNAHPPQTQAPVHPASWRDGLALWAPEHPSLYTVILRLLDDQNRIIDEVSTYAGMRKIDIHDGKFRLNNRPYFQALVLDQGYWRGGGMTAPTDEDLRKDIIMMKEIGLNGARKHQKLEDPRWLYWADQLGFLLWSEMANAYEYSTQYASRFVAEWTEAVLRDVSHPCIVTWVPINESWGVPELHSSPAQVAHLKTLYHLTHSLDPQHRPVVDNDGWEHTSCTDLLTFHDYIHAEVLANTCRSVEVIQMDKGGHTIWVPPARYVEGMPILCTEMGGIKLEGGGAQEGGWGYTTAKGERDLLDRIRGVVDAVIDGGIVQGYCYTQATDIEQETNGLLTWDRQHKLDPRTLSAVFGRRP